MQPVMNFDMATQDIASGECSCAYRTSKGPYSGICRTVNQVDSQSVLFSRLCRAYLRVLSCLYREVSQQSITKVQTFK